MAGNWWSRGQTKNKVARDPSIPETIRDWELNSSGWRYDEANTGYKLTWEQLLEYERQNAVIGSDEEFDAWFTEFRTKQGITSRSYAGSLSSYGDWSETTWEEKPKSKWLSGWWAKDTYKGLAGSSSLNTRLALILTAVKTTIRVVDDTVPPLVVSWATEASSTSYTDFKNNKIVINPAPVKDTKMEDGEAIDITTGFALHEASHSQYSRDPYKDITKPEPLRPMGVAGMLLNIVEDIRIEAMTSERFPGFTGYFDKSLAWAWGQSQKHIPEKWGPDVWQKLNAILTIIRFPEGPATLKDPSFAPEIPWWTTWRDEYLANKVDARTTIQRGLDRLREDEETAEQMDKLEAEEKANEEAWKSLKKAFGDAMKKALEEMKKGGMEPCVNDIEDADVISGEELTEVERLVNEELRKEMVHIKTPNGGGNHPLYVMRPLENDASKRSYIGKPKPVLSRLKAALIFRQELPRFTTRLLKRGGLDEEELWRWADQDYRVFNEEVIAARPQTQMSLLVDMSGSMYGHKLRTAQELAQLFIWALKDIEGVDTKVFGHTGDNTARTGSVDIYRLWEPGDSMTRLGLINTLPHANNYDGHAIAWCAKEILTRGQPEEQRIIIVLSDGYPAGISYGGAQGERHVKMVTDWCERNKVQVIQIAIDEELDSARQARMFRQHIPFTDLEALPKQLTRLLDKLT